MKTVATLHIDLLLEIEIVLQPLILELLVKVLVLPAVDVIHNLLLKVCLIFNRHSLAIETSGNTLLDFASASTVGLGG
jgi:hypothetical protein